MARIRVKEGWCEGHARCVAAAPELFAIDDDEQVVVLADPIPPELVEAARAAVARCPRTTLELVEEG